MDYFDRQFDEIEAEQPGPCLELQRMSVKPAFQGKGVGTHCLRQALQEADDAGYFVILSTQKSVNVSFYERLGFLTVRESDFTPCGNGSGEAYHNWFMVRSPQLRPT
eukprot:CAMPEP_0185035016 /NCGR_PEP_ID=MMETSP1103-20130426/25657_1 /TAXON_ID=36769 /ORGANISM="Paraphysomonas bandaiensis, Strain Caron Lab Isolate" /LENGTH=106 /DNA_ID=CAMNT_0027571915 /DNA_START=420 /DNA_END=740 /DNA_ORIENTATION=-